MVFCCGGSFVHSFTGCCCNRNARHAETQMKYAVSELGVKEAAAKQANASKELAANVVVVKRVSQQCTV